MRQTVALAVMIFGCASGSLSEHGSEKMRARPLVYTRIDNGRLSRLIIEDKNQKDCAYLDYKIKTELGATYEHVYCEGHNDRGASAIEVIAEIISDGLTKIIFVAVFANDELTIYEGESLYWNQKILGRAQIILESCRKRFRAAQKLQGGSSSKLLNPDKCLRQNKENSKQKDDAVVVKMNRDLKIRRVK